ncbi:hypothetical protein Tco_0782149 [Tanacetum coccineum]
MEVLTVMLKRKVCNEEEFKYHSRCEKQKIINVCFADDLIVFVRGDVVSARVTMEALEEFKRASGLVPSIPKSSAFFCNVANHVKASILHIMPFDEGTLPIKYLGVPLISSRLLYRDCKFLVERVQNQITYWKNRTVNVWLFWCQGEMKRGKAKVSWDSIRSYIREFCWVPIGDGKSSAWFDKWDVHCPLMEHLSPRIIARAGFSLQALVADIVQDGTWKWPSAWYDLYPVLNQVGTPTLLHDTQDKCQWRLHAGQFKDFSVGMAWDSIRVHRDVVPWYRTVWFSACMPRHAFHLWQNRSGLA